MQDPTDDVRCMADLISSHDWASTPLGAMDGWPQCLRTAVDIMLGSGHAMQLAWGPERTVLYNDAYAPMLGGRHPGAVGLPFRLAWPEIWADIEPLVERVFAGETLRFKDLPLVMTRHGYAEDTWWTFSYSPVRDGSGAVAGLVNVTLEATGRVRAERERDEAHARLQNSEKRQAFLLGLSDALRPLADAVAIQAAASRLLAEHLGVHRAMYSEFEGAGDARRAFIRGQYVREGAPFPSPVSYGEFIGSRAVGDVLSAGGTLVVADTARAAIIGAEMRRAWLSAGTAAIVAVGLVRNGEEVAHFGVHSDVPRDWTPGEVELVREVAERTWAANDRARAEAARHESEERLRQFGEASQDVLWIRDAETLQWQYLTPAFETIYGLRREEVLAGNNYRSWLDLILPEDRARATEAIRRVRAGEHVAFDYRIRRPRDGTIRWLRNTDFPIADENGRVALVGGIGHDLTELREAELRLQALIEGIPQLVWRAVDGGTWTWASPQWTSHTGLSEAESRGWGWLDALHPDDRPRAREAWGQAVEAGGFEVEYRVRRAGGHGHRWFQTRATPVRDDTGAIVEWLGTSTDIHELRELQERQQVLVAELQHRTRNLLGIVRAMANRMGEASRDLADFRDRFQDRLEALARVQGLLSRLGETDRVTFDELIRSELSAMDGQAERVMLSGPSGIRLRSSTVQALAMALHELATNAVKYGALGQPQARLAIRWRMHPTDPQGRPWLHIDWRESGVRMPGAGVAPQGSGQGRELIEQALPYQLSAQTSFELGPDGVHCTIAIPVSASNMRSGGGHG